MGSEHKDLIRGENNCPAYSKTDSPCTDLFFTVVPGSTREHIEEKLISAWSDDPYLALKVIFNFGNVRKEGGGKQDAINFCRAMIWMWENHPQTVLLNLDQIRQHASLKVLLDMYMHILHDKIPCSPYNLDTSICLQEKHKELRDKDYREIKLRNRKEARKEERKNAKDPVELKQRRSLLHKEYQQTEAQRQLKLKNDIRGHLRSQFGEASNASQLRDSVAQIFSRGLAAEFRQLIKQNKTNKVETEKSKLESIGGLFAKWAPTKNKTHDKATKLVHTIIPMLLWEVQEYIHEHPYPLLAERKNALLQLVKLQSENPGKSVAHLYKSNDNLRCAAENVYQKIFLANIRRKAEVPEHFIGTNEFEKVNYNRMASRCRLLFGQKVFAKHDKAGYEKFLLDAAKNSLLGKKGAKVNVGSVLPHELTVKAVKLSDSCDTTESLEINLQWQALVQSMKEKLESSEDNLGDWLPLCDVSGSMHGQPMQVAIALSLLMAETSFCGKDNAWGGKIMTFEESPRIVDIKGIPTLCTKEEVENAKSNEELSGLLGNLSDRAHQVERLPWGGSTNIERAFDEILKICTENALSREEVGNFRLCIFSDMEFDQARGGPNSWDDGYNDSRNDSWETMHSVIERKFRIAGYPDTPTIIYWNLRASRSIPIHDTNKPGVSLLSGFSAGLMRKFLNGQLELEEEEVDEGAETVKVKKSLTPLETLLKVVDTEMYENLQVAEDDLLIDLIDTRFDDLFD